MLKREAHETTRSGVISEQFNGNTSVQTSGNRGYADCELELGPYDNKEKGWNPVWTPASNLVLVELSFGEIV